MKKLFLTALACATILLSAVVYFSLKKAKNNSSNISLGCSPTSLSGAIVSAESLALFEGKEIGIPQVSLHSGKLAVLGSSSDEKWIEVDLSEQRLRAWEGDNVVLESLVSTGLPWWPTPTGEFRIWIKMRATKMEGGEGKYYYYLPNVPYVMFFENAQVPGWRGYGLHGTYWHDDFGTQRSHGCVNLPTEVAAQLYDWVTPELGNNKWAVRATNVNPGTRIVIHE